MKTLTTFYSRTKNTKTLAIKIANKLNSNLDEIIDKKNRKGFLRAIIAAKDALLKKQTKIETKKHPSDYDLVIIGTPVWAATMTPAVRTYLKNNKFKKIAFFATYGSHKGKTFKAMEKITKGELIASLGVKEKEIENINVTEFCDKITS